MTVAMSYKSDIPLVRASSATSSKYPPSYRTQYTQLSSFADWDNASEVASTITPLFAAPNFTPTSFLQIQSVGKTPISFPTPGKELEIPIFSVETGRPVYLSIRQSRRKGSCRLVNAEDETETTIARTTYWFGPGRSPQVRIGADDDIGSDTFNLDSKGLLTRTVVFESRRWGKFEWRYAKKNECTAVGDQINNILVLEKIFNEVKGKEKRVRIAQLVRSKQTRTPGTKAMDAGNGGRLEMCLGGLERDGKEPVLDEVTVVLTCLAMLKKEIDRLRTTQIMIMSGAASGGGS
jgi:hypothetical protein